MFQKLYHAIPSATAPLVAIATFEMCNVCDQSAYCQDFSL
jgi:hypothetical protein